MQIVYREPSDRLEMSSCIHCGTPLLELEGIKAIISGTQELFCKGDCVGQHRQQQTITFR